MPTFKFIVDDEEYTTTEHTLTPRQILELVGLDAAKHYLVELQGNHPISFQSKPEETLHMHQQMKFHTVSLGPTPVS